MKTFGDLTVPKVEQSGPGADGEFVYVDISSIDNQAKRIVEPKRLASDSAPSRARQRLRAGDVLVSMTRPNLNAVALVPPELDGAIGSTGFHVLRATEGVDQRWLFYAVQTSAFVKAMCAVVQGALYPAVRPKDIRDYAVEPPSLNRQREIVAELERQFSRLDEAVANLQRVKANLKRYKAAVLKAAVEGRLVETEASLARREGRSFQQAEELLMEIREQQAQVKQGRGVTLPVRPGNALSLPKGWAWSSLGELLSERLVNGLSIKESATPTEVRALRLSAMRGDSIDFSDVRHLPISPGEVKDIEIVEGDIFVSRGNGSLDLVGKACIAGTPPAPTIFPDTMMRLRFTRVAPVADWIFRIWPCRLVRAQIEDKVKTTAGIYKIAQPELASVRLPLPPLAEQRRIVAEVDRRLSVIREVEAEVNANLQRAQALRQSVLSKQFL